MAINIVLTMAEASASSSAHMQLTMKFNSDLIWFKCTELLRFVETMVRNYVVKRYLVATNRIPVLAQWFLSLPRGEHCKLLYVNI